MSFFVSEHSDRMIELQDQEVQELATQIMDLLKGKASGKAMAAMANVKQALESERYDGANALPVDGGALRERIERVRKFTG